MRPVAQIAQSVEQGIENPRVGGSIPSLGTKIPRNPQGTMCPRGFFIACNFMVAGPFLDQGALGVGLKAVQLTFGTSPGTE